MKLIRSSLIFCVILSLYCFSFVSAMKLKDVLIPPNGIDGDSAVLRCEFSLDQGEMLLFLRWYKDGVEFFRFGYYQHPSTRMTTFPVEGVHVDKEMSDVDHITLRKITQKTSGTYQCLVSMDWPHYQVMTHSGYLHVTGEGEITFSSESKQHPDGFNKASSRTGGISLRNIFYFFTLSFCINTFHTSF